MPPLTVTITREGRVCVLSVSGELDIATTPTLTPPSRRRPAGTQPNG